MVAALLMLTSNHKKEMEGESAGVLIHFILLAEGQEALRGDMETHKCFPLLASSTLMPSPSACLLGTHYVYSVHFNKQQNTTQSN